LTEQPVSPLQTFH